MAGHSHYDPSNTSLELVGSKALKRVNLHSSDNGLQVMVLHMEHNHTYEFILDDCEGFITFTGISGCLYIETIHPREMHIVNKHKLTTGCVLMIPRNIYRKTFTTDEPAIYVEHIENGFRPDRRIRLDESVK